MIDIENYLDEEQKREIAERAFYDSMKESFSGKNQDYILYYVTQEYVRQLISDVLGEDYKEKISQKVLTAIDELSAFIVFRDGDRYGRESIARKHLNDCMEQSKEKIFKKLNDVIDLESSKYFEDVIQDATYDYISENLFKSNKE